MVTQKVLVIRGELSPEGRYVRTIHSKREISAHLKKCVLTSLLTYSMVKSPS